MKRKIEKDMIQWKNKSTGRLPLILNGARQVGKTFLLREFGERFYDNTVYVNLETNPAIASFFDDDISPARIIRFLEASYKTRILPDKTLIILDEIQSCERALTSLKYFAEDAPEYHVAAAGSLLGVAINREHYSFPVGRVETHTLRPFDFEEFLWANGEEGLRDEIRSCYEKMKPMPEALHKKATELYRLYLIIGGMPACINTFLRDGSLLYVSNVQKEITDNYIADMAKYATNTDSVKIRACYASIPAQLAKENKKFQYKIVQKGATAALFGVSIEWLNLAGVVLKCKKIEHAFEPISVYTDLSSFKLYMGDTGLLVMQSGISYQTILGGGENIFMGAVTENYVAQELVAKGHDLYYWTSGASAELDFVIQTDADITAIEVKKGLHTRSKSLGVFSTKYHQAQSIVFSGKNFGTSGSAKAIPLYAVFCF